MDQLPTDQDVASSVQNPPGYYKRKRDDEPSDSSGQNNGNLLVLEDVQAASNDTLPFSSDLLAYLDPHLGASSGETGAFLQPNSHNVLRAERLVATASPAEPKMHPATPAPIPLTARHNTRGNDEVMSYNPYFFETDEKIISACKRTEELPTGKWRRPFRSIRSSANLSGIIPAPNPPSKRSDRFHDLRYPEAYPVIYTPPPSWFPHTAPPQGYPELTHPLFFPGLSLNSVELWLDTDADALDDTQLKANKPPTNVHLLPLIPRTCPHALFGHLSGPHRAQALFQASVVFPNVKTITSAGPSDPFPHFSLFPCHELHPNTPPDAAPLPTTTEPISLEGLRYLSIWAYNLRVCAEVFSRLKLPRNISLNVVCGRPTLLEDPRANVTNQSVKGTGTGKATQSESESKSDEEETESVEELLKFPRALLDALTVTVPRSVAHLQDTKSLGDGAGTSREEEWDRLYPRTVSIVRDTAQFMGWTCMRLFAAPCSVDLTPGSLAAYIPPPGPMSAYTLPMVCLSYSTLLRPILRGLSFAHVTHISLNLSEFASGCSRFDSRNRDWQTLFEYMVQVEFLHLQRATGWLVVRFLWFVDPEDNRVLFNRLRTLVLEDIVWDKPDREEMAAWRQKSSHRAYFERGVRRKPRDENKPDAKPVPVHTVRVGDLFPEVGMSNAKLFGNLRRDEHGSGTGIAFAETCLRARAYADRRIDTLKIVSRYRAQQCLRKAYEKKFRASVGRLEWCVEDRSSL